MNRQSLSPYRLYGTLMWLLSALFAFRVSAQLLILNYPQLPLPAFEHWHSEILAYPVLVAFQVAILFLLGFLSYRVFNNQVTPNAKKGKQLLIFGAVYFIVMSIRLAISLSPLQLSSSHLAGVSDISWFQRPLPSFFHLVLASFVLIQAHCYLIGDKDA